jgi:nucleoid-associated protein YgaU
MEGTSPSVLPYITQLKKVCYNYIDEIHGPPFVKITWGKIMPSGANAQDQVDGVFKGRLKSMNVDFTLFGAEGNPVRAEISMTFGSAVNPETRPTGNSPDLTHIIEVKFGDNLPKLCKDVYGSPEYFLQIARVNNLTSIYAIEPGMKLIFPPLEKSSR